MLIFSLIFSFIPLMQTCWFMLAPWFHIRVFYLLERQSACLVQGLFCPAFWRSRLFSDQCKEFSFLIRLEVLLFCPPLMASFACLFIYSAIYSVTGACSVDCDFASCLWCCLTCLRKCLCVFVFVSRPSDPLIFCISFQHFLCIFLSPLPLACLLD